MEKYAKAIQEADKADSLRVLGLEKEIGNMSELGLTLADETRSEEHTSELQSRTNLVCRLLLEKKKKKKKTKKKKKKKKKKQKTTNTKKKKQTTEHNKTSQNIRVQLG